MTDRMTVDYVANGVVIEGNLRIRNIEHGSGFIPVIEMGDKYKTSYLAEILEKELNGDESSFDSILFGKARITIQKLGGDND